LQWVFDPAKEEFADRSHPRLERRIMGRTDVAPVAFYVRCPVLRGLGAATDNVVVTSHTFAGGHS
jgi:hypothetical protein